MRFTIRPVLGLSAILALGAAVPAHAAFMSTYTDINLDECLVLDADDFGATWACPGYKGYPVQINEGDLRFNIRYGFNVDAEPDPASFGAFNELGPRIEWRLSNAAGRWLPVATVVRYHLADNSTGENRYQVLVVTQLKDGQTCPIAMIDALSNADANALAQQAADGAGDFDCANDEIAKPGTFDVPL